LGTRVVFSARRVKPNMLIKAYSKEIKKPDRAGGQDLT